MNRYERKSALTRPILEFVRHHAIAVVALVCSILAMAGSSYAAFTISGSQIANHTIAPTKFDPKFINGSVKAWAVVDPAGHVAAGAGGPQVSAAALLPGFYVIKWGVNMPGRCSTVASTDAHLSPRTYQLPANGAAYPAGFTVASTVGLPRNRNQGAQTVVYTYNQSGQLMALGFDIAVIC
jgi:hypothetical protein